MAVAKKAIPYIIAFLVALVMIVYIPAISLVLLGKA
jgi:TRAP-type C4-dicarboxylate transport system permease large subunit